MLSYLHVIAVLEQRVHEFSIFAMQLFSKLNKL